MYNSTDEKENIINIFFSMTGRGRLYARNIYLPTYGNQRNFIAIRPIVARNPRVKSFHTIVHCALYLGVSLRFSPHPPTQRAITLNSN